MSDEWTEKMLNRLEREDTAEERLCYDKDALISTQSALLAQMAAALEGITFTAQKLWDDAKPIKDGAAFAVTHPMIEQAKSALTSYRTLSPDPQWQNAAERLKQIADLTKPGQEVGVSQAVDIICDVWNIANRARGDG